MNPADLEAQARVELGFSRRLKQPRRISPSKAINISRASIYQWADRLELFRQTGNRERTTIVGVDILNLVTYITAWPDATLDKMAVLSRRQRSLLGRSGEEPIRAE